MVWPALAPRPINSPLLPFLRRLRSDLPTLTSKYFPSLGFFTTMASAATSASSAHNNSRRVNLLSNGMARSHSKVQEISIFGTFSPSSSSYVTWSSNHGLDHTTSAYRQQQSKSRQCPVRGYGPEPQQWSPTSHNASIAIARMLGNLSVCSCLLEGSLGRVRAQAPSLTVQPRLARYHHRLLLVLRSSDTLNLASVRRQSSPRSKSILL